MFSWLPSWLPSLPSSDYFSLPSSIQGRFISFILKRSLGHFLKPGQLDPQQIDSQVGSGYIQVNDLELDTSAVNDLLQGLPLSLESGTIGSATARIPWPNPLTAAVGFSFNSLHVILRVQQDHTRTTQVDLADSVASYAQSFIHEELESVEEAELKGSLRVERLAKEEDNVPGGINPFLDTPEEFNRADIEPDGVSLFAVLIERLLAKFQCDAKDTRITLLDSESGSSVTLSVAEIRYHTDVPEMDEGHVAREHESEGEVRKLTISGVTMNVRQSIHNRQDEGSSPGTTGRSSPASSESSMDANARWTMSQSLAFLPPHSSDPSDSIASASMYESAVSTNMPRDPNEVTEDPPPHGLDSFTSKAYPDTPSELSDTLISFGPEPIVVQLITPPLRTINTAHQFNVRLLAKTGIIRLVLRAWHIRCLIQLVSAITSHSNPAPPTGTEESGSSLGSGIQLNLDIGGIVLLLLPHLPSNAGSPDPMMDRFFAHPLTGLPFTEDCLRLHVERISLATSIDTGSTDKITVTLSSTLAVGDISLFSFHPDGKGQTGEASVIVSPVLITDPLLAVQYVPQHVHPGSNAQSEEISLPSFEVVDWTSDQVRHYGTRLSSWRTKQKQLKSLHATRRQSSAPDSGPSNDTAVRIFLERKSSSNNSSSLDIDTNVVFPLHLFLDVRWIASESGILAFIDEISRSEITPGTPKQDPVLSRRKAFQIQTLKDLDLRLNYLEEDEVNSGLPAHSTAKDSPSRKQTGLRKQSQSPSRIVVGIPMIRVQARCPPGAGQDARSGAVIFDVRDVKLAIGDERTTPKVTSFGQLSVGQTFEGKTVLLAEMGTIVLSLCPPASDKANALLSLGSLIRTRGLDQPHDHLDVQPRIAITQSEPQRLDTSVTSTLNLDFPSVVIKLSKSVFDGLQYWADDVSQTFQLALEKDALAEIGSRDTSMIGSRYFAQSTTGSGETSINAQSKERKGEFVIKFLIHEAFVRILLPRQEEAMVPRPVDVLASVVDVLVEIKPEGRDQTFVTASTIDLSVINHTASRGALTLFSLASPRNLLLISKPILKLRYTSLVIPGTNFKESKVRISLWGFIYTFSSDTSWMTDLAAFATAPPGAFETVVPSERTSLNVRVMDGSIRANAPNHPGQLIVHMDEVEFATELIGNTTASTFRLSVPSLGLLAIDDIAGCIDSDLPSETGVAFWTKRGHALLAEIANLKLSFESSKGTPDTKVMIDRAGLRLHLCADTMAAVTAFIDDLLSAFAPVPKDPQPKRKKRPTFISEAQEEKHTDMLSSVDDLAFKRVPQIGPAPDMIYDDLPTNPDYLDESFGAAAGLRELTDEDLDDFDQDYIDPVLTAEEGQKPGIVSRYGGETIRLLRSEGLKVVDDYFDNLPPEDTNDFASLGETALQVHIRNSDVNVLLYDGYDWTHTRRTIENEVKEMRKKLAKIRQLVANGQTQETDVEETSALLFNSVYIGLKQNVDELEPTALVAAIDEELREDLETASQGSWQTLPAPSLGMINTSSTRTAAQRLARSRGSNIEFQVIGLNATFDQYKTSEQLVSKAFATIENLEILDHIKTSTWKKFLTALRSDSRGNIRETGSSMVRFELRTLKPVPEDPSEENRLRLKILPLRLHVDQDALDFLKKFFGFKDPRYVSAPSDPDEGTYFRRSEVFPVDLKLDYKPRRVDYRALREGRTIELMNFFHFDGAEMTLRHITLSGITGWARLGELLNDLWTPDVKATQLVDVISGVSPIRSVVNVGSGIADLVLLPISQYKKDGRIVRGVQKGTTAFVKSTAAEAIKLGARLATGTQVILEQAEGVLGTEFKTPIMAETLQIPDFPVGGISGFDRESFTEEDLDLISKYAEQPMNLKEGIHSAYKSLQKNFNSAAQTILAVPMEVYERSGNEGPVRSVIRAVPIAVLRPMIGASEAVSKTLLGLHNSLDPNLRHDYDAKYKHR
ncbi:hypothetical protein L218DRAFT_860278 [Marasmius fiardii PR-910]|nr:hypothetical protein L218DRAFT_860278 [Marasmius fiardii PR-910]